jgi:prepilin-type processing-associated H-X9-DG protein
MQDFNSNLTPRLADDWAARTAAGTSRGFFRIHKEAKFRDIQDGLANTIAMGEIISDLADTDKRSAVSWDGGGSANDVRNNPMHCLDSNELDPESPNFWCAAGSTGCTPPVSLISGDINCRGMSWATCRPSVQEFYTIRPPNSELCIGQWADNPGMLSASSRHQGGAHILMGDGAVIFITDSIEAGNQNAQAIHQGNLPGKASPYGLWGALGSKGAKEKIEEQLNQ